MRALLERLKLLLELGQPAGDELDVGEHHPATLDVHLVERLLGHHILALAQADADELALVLRLAEAVAQHLYVGVGVDAGREEEEDGHGGA